MKSKFKNPFGKEKVPKCHRKLPKRHTSSNRRRFQVDITSITQITKFQRISTSFLRTFSM